MKLSTGLLAGFALLAAGCGAASNGAPTGDECTTNADCTNSQAAKDIGRCGARDVYCQAGRCGAVCRNICETVIAEANSCGNEGLICNQSAATSPMRQGYCTGIPISCQLASECPIYRPSTDAAAAVWECADGVCRYSGFHYLIE